jgi:hypothetical protein
MKDADIKQESSTLSESNRGAKGSSELLKNHYRATKGTKTKFITIQALTSSGITTDTEEEGVVTTSDVSVVFQQCGEATKELLGIITQYDYHKAVEIPELVDETKAPSSGLSRDCRFVSCRLRPGFADTSCRVGDMSATRRWSCRCRGDISCRLGGLNDTTFDDMSRHVVNVCNNMIVF